MGFIVRLYTVSTKRMPDSGLLAQREQSPFLYHLNEKADKSNRKKGGLARLQITSGQPEESVKLRLRINLRIDTNP
jgi:hypothetical protein